MSNLPILYFTLGMLAGLPLGYRMAAVWYEEVLPAWLLGPTIWALCMHVDGVNKEVDRIVADIKAAGIVARRRVA